MNILVSIIVPIYNSENYLKKCIGSITNQTLSNIEIILINDGSTDRSKEIINEFAKKDNRIVAIHKENSGPAATRNLGIKIANGDYFGFVDADDTICNTMYEKLVNRALESNAQVAMCNYKDITVSNNKYYEVKHNLDTKGLKDKTYIRENIIRKITGDINYGFFTLCNKIYLKSWINDIGLSIDESRDHGEDWWFNINMFIKLERFICIEECLYNYIHINQASLMSKYREEQFDLCLDGRLKILSIIPDELIDYKSLNRTFIYEFSSYIIRTLENIKDKSKCNTMISNVIRNEEVRYSCKNVNGLPIHFKIIILCIRLGMRNLAIFIYKIIAKLR